MPARGNSTRAYGNDVTTARGLTPPPVDLTHPNDQEVLVKAA
ncbi:MAG: hypothetical protein ACRDRI_25060 [Pseudonocardiaceae bacterium]